MVSLSWLLLFGRLTVLGLSVYGYLRRIGRFLRMEFAPGVFFTGLCSVMFFAGILNILPETAWAVCGCGVYLAAQSLRRKESVKDFLCPGMVFFFLASGLLLILLHGTVLTDYDDFSHWGTVLKVMYTKHRFPNYADSTITYQSYPTGSAAFVYYFLTVSGITSEWFQLVIQSVFQIGLLTSLFLFVRGVWGWIFAAGTAGLLLLCSNGPINLLVDTLLPLIAVAALCLCFYYRSDLTGRCLWVLPYLIALTAVKNSGLLLALFLLLYLLMHLGKENRRIWLQLGSIPALTLLLWQKHVLLVFDNGMNSRHAMSAESITNTFSQKDLSALTEVARLFLQEVFSLTNPFLYLLIAGLLVLLLHRFFGLHLTWDHRHLLLFAGAAYLIYQIGVLAMYLTTMPYGEAILLAGYSRYHRTILILCGSCLFLVLADSMTKTGKREVTAGLLTLLLLYQSLFPGLWYNNPKHCGFIREEFQQLITEYHVEAGKRYLIVMDAAYAEKYKGYLHYLARYLLDSGSITLCSIESPPEEHLLSNYDYLICFGDSEELDGYLVKTVGSGESRILRLS